MIKEAKLKGPIIVEPEDPPISVKERGETFINMWKDELLVEDENSQVLCVQEFHYIISRKVVLNKILSALCFYDFAALCGDRRFSRKARRFSKKERGYKPRFLVGELHQSPAKESHAHNTCEIF